MTNRQFFLQAVNFLDGTENFTDIVLQGQVMRTSKKTSYWSTVTFRGYQGGNFIGGVATIYANLRDLKTRDKILEAIDHEANHIKPMHPGFYSDLILKEAGLTTG